MSRRPRLALANVPLHIIQRGNNRAACFVSPADYLVYLDMLMLCARESSCEIHAYVLMTNHVHLLVSPAYDTAAGALMKALGQRYVQYINRRYQRTGTLWEGRYRSCIVEDERYFLVCQRYIELNPVRADMVIHPVDYEWSSYRINAHGQKNSLISPHAVYLQLGNSQEDREAAYRALFLETISSDTLKFIRSVTNGNSVFGSEAFLDQIAVDTGFDVGLGRRGRRLD